MDSILTHFIKGTPINSKEQDHEAGVSKKNQALSNIGAGANNFKKLPLTLKHCEDIDIYVAMIFLN